MVHKKTIVIHCRDAPDSDLAFSTLVKTLIPLVPKFHPFHFHCFLYSRKHMYNWLNHFPNSYFGFTSVHFRDLDSHLDLMTHVSLQHLLLESDSPYLGRSSSSLYPLIVRFSIIRNISIPELLNTIYFNTIRIYNIQI